MKVHLKWAAQCSAYLATSVVAMSCANSSGPDPKYSDLSKKTNEIVTRTQGDPSRMTDADRKVMQEARDYRIVTPPGYVGS
ncbi:MAG: hypothetical protein BGO01_02075 [Armatimonadetes bacterium 55-13]|nr:hypothetical protein [Armatimonadota bacterium]OJU65719.1 MAG: hypothetical protein BGO01_02075 [Armatimonadetes bacterium 55-13]